MADQRNLAFCQLLQYQGQIQHCDLHCWTQRVNSNRLIPIRSKSEEVGSIWPLGTEESQKLPLKCLFLSNCWTESDAPLVCYVCQMKAQVSVSNFSSVPLLVHTLWHWRSQSSKLFKWSPFEAAQMSWPIVPSNLLVKKMSRLPTLLLRFHDECFAPTKTAL